VNGGLLEENLALVKKMDARFHRMTVKGAEASFALGKALFEIKMKRDQGIFWKDFVKGNFPFSVASANNHIRLYERFKDRPGGLAGKSAAEALREARRE
jgi:hypothetical protein